MTRRNFLALTPAAVAAVGLVPLDALAQVEKADVKNAIYPEFPRQDPARVQLVVGAAHRDLAKVKELVTASPALAKSAWDWGFGDWETPLGAASHVGRPEIAEFLIENGARPDIFYHAMMDHLQAVQALVECQPGIQRIPGPHGITLLQHARNGDAKKVQAYLEKVGDADHWHLSRPVSDEEKARFVGKYRFGEGENDVLVIDTNGQGMLSIKRGKDPDRIIHRIEENAFAPTGAPKVLLRFRVEGGRVADLTIHDPEPILTARRL